MNHEFGTDRRSSQRRETEQWFRSAGATRHDGERMTRVDTCDREARGCDSQAIIRGVFGQCPAPILITRISDDRILYESVAAQKLLACSRPRIGAPLWAQWVSAVDYDSFKRRLIEATTLDGVEIRLQRNDGSAFCCAISAQALSLFGDEVMFVSMLDLTDHHAAQSEIARQRDVLHEAEKLSSLGEVLAGISHELNDPLSVLAGQALMLQEKAPDAATAQRAARISSAADRCARIVRSFLALARQRPDSPAPIDVNAVVEEALDLTGHLLRTIGADVALRLAPTLPRVLANPDQVRQLVMNLILNARHALEDVEGRRVLTLRTAHQVDERRVTITVADNGAGVSDEIRARIFEPLYTTKPPGKGTGLGLALCRRIAEAHGGEIELAAPSARGAKFVVSIPEIDPASSAAAAGDSWTKASDEKHDVLIVEATRQTSQSLSEILRRDGHGVEVVESGFVGLERLRRAAYDIIFCGLGMDGSDGQRSFRSLSETRPKLARRVVFIADAPGRDAIAYLDSTERPFLSPPFRRSAVREVVELLSLRSLN